MTMRLAMCRVLAAGTLGACLALQACSQAGGPATPLGVQGGALRNDAVGYGVLRSMSASEDPEAGLTAVNGTLYGTTHGNGTSDFGTVFSITPSGTQKTLYRFTNGADGGFPEANLVYVKGELYGTTYAGNGGAGVVFRVNPSTGKETVVYSFKNGSAPYDGSNPTAPLLYLNSTFYGTTSRGGTDRAGTVFSLTPSGTYHVLYNFFVGNNDGCDPQAGLIAVNGVLYGTTTGCGTTGNGTVFSVTTAGVQKTLHTFAISEGEQTVAPLVYVNGLFYGVTQVGGPASGDGGTLFSMTPAGKIKVLHLFTYTDGYQPYAGLTVVGNKLYGTTNEGGLYGRGVAFVVGVTGSGYAVLHNFGNAKDGAQPHGTLLKVGSTLYGTTTFGGRYNKGTVLTLAL